MWTFYFTVITLGWLLFLKGGLSKTARERREDAWGRKSLIVVLFKIATFQKCPTKVEVSRYEKKMRIFVGLFLIIIIVGSLWITYNFIIQFI